MPTIQSYLHAAYLWLAAINPILPWAAIVLVPCWLVPMLMRRFFPHTWQLLPGVVDRVLLDFGLPVDLWGSGALRVIIQSLPALALGAVAAALSVHADPKHAFWGVIAGAFAPALHEGIKRLSVPYPWLVPLLGSFPAAGTGTPNGKKVGGGGAAGAALLLLCAGLALGGTSGCGLLHAAVPTIDAITQGIDEIDAAVKFIDAREQPVLAVAPQQARDGYAKAMALFWGSDQAAHLALQGGKDLDAGKIQQAVADEVQAYQTLVSQLKAAGFSVVSVPRGKVAAVHAPPGAIVVPEPALVSRPRS